MTNTDLNTKEEGKKVYEVGYLLLPNIEESKISEESSSIRDIIEKNNGMFLSEGMPEMKNLAYPMTKMIASKKQKFDNAYFGWVKFESDSESINVVKTELDKMDSVLRFLIIITTKEDSRVSSAPVKTGKFSFDEGKKEEEKNEEKVEEKTEKTEEKAGEDKKEKPEKKLDETIDDLVIE